MEKLSTNKFILLATKYGVEFADWNRPLAETIVAQRMKIAGETIRVMPDLEETTPESVQILTHRRDEIAEMIKFCEAVKHQTAINLTADYPILKARFDTYIGDPCSDGTMKTTEDVCTECEKFLLEVNTRPIDTN